MAFSDWLRRVFGRGSWIDEQLTNFDNNTLGGLVGNIRSRSNDIGQSLINSLSGAGLTGADIEAQKHQDLREDTLYQRTVADMKAAGLNPMMLAGGAAVNNSDSAIAGNNGSVNLGEIMNATLLEKQGKLLDAQTANINKDTESKDAGIKKTLAEVLHIKADVKRIEDLRNVLHEQARKLCLDNYVSDVLKGVRIEQERLNIVLTDEQINNVHNAAQRAAKEIGLIAEQIETEDAKQALLSVQKTLVDLDVQDKTKYLIYADALYKAKSEEAQSSAQQAALEFAYNSKLLTDDYAKAIIDKAKAEGAISKNLEWNSNLVHDLVTNKKRPDKYAKGLTSEDWRVLRNGLLDPVFFNASMSGYSQSANSNSIIN